MIKNIQKIMSRDIIYIISLKTHPSKSLIRVLFIKEDPLYLFPYKRALWVFYDALCHSLKFSTILGDLFYFRRLFSLYYSL